MRAMARVGLHARAHRSGAPPELYAAPHWFACRTRARAEKRVDHLLGRSGIATYLPLVHVDREWADRRARVALPMFPAYVFVRCMLQETDTVLRIPGVVSLADPNGYPTPIQDEELRSIRTLVSGINATGILPSTSDFLEPGEPVVVTSGPFEGMTGVLSENRGRSRVAVRITALRLATSIEVDRRILKARTDGARTYSRTPG